MDNRYSIEVKHYDNYNGGGARIYVDGQLAKGCTASGCGYDREGAALGNWVEKEFQDELLKIFKADVDALEEPTDDVGVYGGIKLTPDPDRVSRPWYGVTVQKVWKKSNKVTSKITIDGATGKDNVFKILKQLGFQVSYIPVRSKYSSVYHITRNFLYVDNYK